MQWKQEYFWKKPNAEGSHSERQLVFTPVCKLITASVKSNAADRFDGEPGASPDETAASCSGRLLNGEPAGGRGAAEVPCPGPAQGQSDCAYLSFKCSEKQNPDSWSEAYTI